MSLIEIPKIKQLIFKKNTDNRNKDKKNFINLY